MAIWKYKRLSHAVLVTRPPWIPMCPGHALEAFRSANWTLASTRTCSLSQLHPEPEPVLSPNFIQVMAAQLELERTPGRLQFNSI